MEIKKVHWMGIISALIVIVLSLFFLNTTFFFFMLGLAVLTGVAPFVYSIILDMRDANEKEEMFLEFSRNLVESVKTGTPISKSIINIKKKSYGVLGPHVEKLANQISLGIPLNVAIKIFAKDVNNPTISRALTLIGQAERAGGDIGKILESVTEAVRVSDKLKKERKAAISTLVVQGYIIFFVFVIIVLVMQFQIIPMISGIAQTDTLGLGEAAESIGQEEISFSFIYLLLVQGFFSGLAIGKLAEGSIKSGLKHSFALMLMSFLISSVANVIFGG